MPRAPSGTYTAVPATVADSPVSWNLSADTVAAHTRQAFVSSMLKAEQVGRLREAFKLRVAAL